MLRLVARLSFNLTRSSTPFFAHFDWCHLPYAAVGIAMGLRLTTVGRFGTKIMLTAEFDA
jgi:hypothetical protein